MGLVAALFAEASPSAGPPAPPLVASAPFTLDTTTRLLVVAPHPDDETLCCGGVITQAVQAGADVAIVWVTSGGGFRFAAVVAAGKPFPKQAGMQRLARQRIGEAQHAADFLGVARDRRFFLGYPDGGVLDLLFANYTSPYRSKYTGASAVPWEEAIDPGSPYEGAALERDFAAVVDRFRPTLVLAASPNDSHPDHRASGILALRVLGARDELDRLRFWIVHGGRGWPAPHRALIERPQTQPPRGAGMPWQPYPVTAAANDTKQNALLAHASQIAVMRGKMMAYVRATELFSVRPVAGALDAAQICIHVAPCPVEPPDPAHAGL